MKTAHLEDMIRGWFVGNFEPTLYKTTDVEVAVKSYQAGDYEAKHMHKIATEISVVISGDIIVMEPGDATDFEALTEAVNVVVKLPGANNDKYIV